MKMDHLDKIRGNITLNTTKKTTTLLDGTYRSIYKGKSLNFEDLREYVIGDNVKDIDWKASARSDNILVKQYIADKKHNILFILDSRKTMRANANVNDLKYDLAIHAAGTLALLANKNGDFISAIYNHKKEIKLFPFKEATYNIELFLSSYENDVLYGNDKNLNDVIDYVTNYIHKKMIILIITDLSGLDELDIEKIKILCIQNDILIINIADINLFENKSFDMDSSKYFSGVFLHNRHLQKLEQEEKEHVFNQIKDEYRKYRIPLVTISNKEEVVLKLIELLEEHKYIISNK